MNDLIRGIEIQDRLTPQLRMILNHCKRVGYITGRSAIMDYGIMSLSRRMVDLQELGFKVRTEERRHPGTGQRYRRYYVEWPEALKEAA